MARFTIKTRDEGGYVRFEGPNRSGTLGTQICEGGGTRGRCYRFGEAP